MADTALVKVAPPARASRRQDRETVGGLKHAASCAAKMKPGQAVWLRQAQAASFLSLVLRAYTGKPFRTYTGTDGKRYVTLDRKEPAHA